MNNDPKAILEAYYAALNARDAEAAIALFAEDAVREDITQPDDSRKITGKAQIANGIRGRVADNIFIEARNFQVTKDKVTCTVQVSTNYWRQRGLAPIEETAEVVVQQGKIISFTTTLTPETVAKIRTSPDEESSSRHTNEEIAISDDFLSITKCPKCTKTHRYKLEVTYSSVMYHLGNFNLNNKPNKKYFTRLFTCPTTNSDFQAKFWMTEESPARIDTLEVKGLVEEKADE